MREVGHHITPKTVTLKNGRKIGIATYGKPEGVPLFFFPGLGVSKLAVYPNSRAAEEAGIYVISVDRPGIGLSDPSPGRRVIDWADDVNMLADAMGIEKFSVLGWSAGAAYALACAYKIPGRLTATGIIGGFGQMSDFNVRMNLTAKMRNWGFVARFAPWLIKPGLKSYYLKLQKDPEAVWAPLLAEIKNADAEVVRDSKIERTLFEAMKDACLNGTEGLYSDIVAAVKPWGFPLTGINAPVKLWHGEDDDLIPVNVAYHLAAALPNCSASFIPGQGHLYYLSHWNEIITALCANSQVQKQAV